MQAHVVFGSLSRAVEAPRQVWHGHGAIVQLVKAILLVKAGWNDGALRAIMLHRLRVCSPIPIWGIFSIAARIVICWLLVASRGHGRVSTENHQCTGE